MVQFTQDDMLKNTFGPYEVRHNGLAMQVAGASLAMGSDNQYTLVDAHEIQLAAQAAERNPQIAVNFIKSLAEAVGVVFDGQDADTADPRYVELAEHAKTLHMVHAHVNDVAYKQHPGIIAELLGVEWIDEDDIQEDEYYALAVLGYTVYEIAEMDEKTYTAKVAEATELVTTLSATEWHARYNDTKKREKAQEEELEETAI